uniref:Secreted protein n=1 Tax=Panagrolaimus sp. ES5 TaxID=591445 RepID=A0AC34GVW4_9BILA
MNSFIFFAVCLIFFVQVSHEFHIDPYPVNPEMENYRNPGNHLPPIIPPPIPNDGDLTDEGSQQNADSLGRKNVGNANNELNGDKRIKREWDPNRGGWIIPW